MTDKLGASLWREASDLEDAGFLEAAIERYSRAIREGSIEAMINLGNIYADKMDADAAVALYEQAVGEGSAVAAWNIAKHYENGGNQTSAAKWMRIAAELGDEDAQEWLKECD